MEHQRNSKLALIIIGVVTTLMIFAIFTLQWYQDSRFKISDYGNSSQAIRAALLEEVPLGSSLDDVYRFMKRNNIANTTNSNDTCGYSELRENRVSLIACTDLFSGMWLIHFSFDEMEHLVDITTVGYYP